MRAIAVTPGACSRPRAAQRARVTIEGDAPLVSRLERPLRRALAGRTARYRVEIARVGDCGELLVGISGPKGWLPLRVDADELDPGYLRNLVSCTLDRFGL